MVKIEFAEEARVSIFGAVQSKVVYNGGLKKQIKREELKKIANGYKVHNSCYQIRSVGNGL